jgi:hypothetical protein
MSDAFLKVVRYDSTIFSHEALVGVNPTTPSSFPVNFGSLLTLKVSILCDFGPFARQMRRTLAGLIAAAITVPGWITFARSMPARRSVHFESCKG